MSGLWLQLGLVAVLVVLNAGFAGSEMALISLREGQLQRLEQQHDVGKVLARLARDPNRFLSTIQVGITLAGFLASATAAVSLAQPLVGPLDFLEGAAEAVAIVLVTVALTFVTLVFGELAPKRVAMQRAERWSLIAARPLAAIARMARPVIWLLGSSTDLVVRLVGGDPSRRREDVTEEEIRDLVAQKAFSPEQRTIISGAIEVGRRTLREVLVPRGDARALDDNSPATDGLGELVAVGHSRAPVVQGDLDDVVGVVHLRDLVGATGRVGDHARTAMALPESVGVADALRTMQTERQELAVVVDEYGGVEGIVTLEDLIEEVVGEIYDETDRDVLAVVRESGDIGLNQPVTGIAATTTRKGYWMVAADGGIFSFGDAAFHGSTGGMTLNRPIVGMASTRSGQGYWLVASDGGIFSFGDAEFFGSTGGIKLNKPIVGMASTPSGQGYWLVASDGGVFTFGDAAFSGSLGRARLNGRIVGMAPTPSGKGYWLAGSGGEVSAFGDAAPLGTPPPQAAGSFVAIAPIRDRNGYMLVAGDGGGFAFGDTGPLGQLVKSRMNQPIVGAVAF